LRNNHLLPRNRHNYTVREIPKEEIRFAQRLLEWSRSAPEHGESFDAWQRGRFPWDDIYESSVNCIEKEGAVSPVGTAVQQQDSPPLG
jgi:hypothetical protein